MITWVRTVDYRDGKANEAMELAVKAANYVNDKFGLNVVVEINVSGKISQLHWVATTDSLASLDEALLSVYADEGYQQMLEESAEQELFWDTSGRDRIFRSIP